jgi:hypothetical protein
MLLVLVHSTIRSNISDTPVSLSNITITTTITYSTRQAVRSYPLIVVYCIHQNTEPDTVREGTLPSIFLHRQTFFQIYMVKTFIWLWEWLVIVLVVSYVWKIIMFAQHAGEVTHQRMSVGQMHVRLQKAHTSCVSRGLEYTIGVHI